jgi:transposase InsO family protein
MRATANKAALEMALKENGSPKIHHSDRGSQYVSRDYLELLKSNNIAISMSLCAQDNAYAERINKTIKEEYLKHWNPKNYRQLKAYINKAVTHYNHKRKHNNIMKLTPIIFEKMSNNNELKTVPILTIFDNEINTKTVNLI